MKERKAIFHFKIELENENVNTLMDLEEIKGVDVTLMGQILKIFANTNKQIKKVVGECIGIATPHIEADDTPDTETES